MRMFASLSVPRSGHKTDPDRDLESYLFTSAYTDNLPLVQRTSWSITALFDCENLHTWRFVRLLLDEGTTALKSASQASQPMSSLASEHLAAWKCQEQQTDLTIIDTITFSSFS
jgi:hypothetical protein